MPGWVDGSGCRCLCECYSTFVTRYTMAANSRLTICMPQDKKLCYILAPRSRWGFWKWGHRALIQPSPLASHPKAVVFLHFCDERVHCTLTWHLDSSNVWRQVNMLKISMLRVDHKNKTTVFGTTWSPCKMTNYSLFHVNKSQEARFKHPCVVGYDNRYLDVVNCIDTM